ncbi:DNA polymerase, partial [Enterobacter hormaechei]
INYNEYREVGHILTDNEIDYLKNDVEIVARALETIFSQNLPKMTQGSNALHDFKNIIGSKRFSKWFPQIRYDHEIRQSYKG